MDLTIGSSLDYSNIWSYFGGKIKISIRQLSWIKIWAIWKTTGILIKNWEPRRVLKYQSVILYNE